jgi:hypothetical protein
MNCEKFYPIQYDSCNTINQDEKENLLKKEAYYSAKLDSLKVVLMELSFTVMLFVCSLWSLIRYLTN